MSKMTVLDIGKRDYKRCTECIMDTTAPAIEFDEKGVCNYCKEQKEKLNNLNEKESMEDVINGILRRSEKNGTDYNAVMGISGGIDSSYLAYLMYQYDLNILLIHVDDGWDTEVAKHNISVVVDKTGWEYKYIKLNSEEYNDIIRAYLDAGVLSLEMISDNVVRKQIYKIAKEYNIKIILSGDNLTSEGILPRCWGHDNNDSRNIKDIHSKHGTIELRDLEFISGTSRILKQILFGYKEFDPLNHLEIPYNRLKAQDILEDVWGWRRYGEKHYENRYTRFLEAYIFPVRFGIDKRIAHYSSLIAANQFSREEALRIVMSNAFDQETYERELNFFLGKLDISMVEFNKYMNSEKHLNNEYTTHEWRLKVYRLLRKIFS